MPTPEPAPTTLPAPTLGALPTAPPPIVQHGPQAIVYVGTYTENTDSEGIYALQMDLLTGQLTPLGLIAKTPNPSFLQLHPSGRFLYAVNELTDYEGQPTGAVSAFRIDPISKRLVLMSIYPTGGGAPCHLTLDRRQRHLLVANYAGGSVASFRIRPDGGLFNATQVAQHEGSSVNPQRQEGPHAHSVWVSPDNRFVMSADLGIDKIVVYRFDGNTGQLTPSYGAPLPPGSGPRHMAFHNNQLFVINELAANITRMKFDSNNGALTPEQTISTLPDGYSGRKSTAEVVVHPNGRFVYGSNRGDDSIAVFTLQRDGLKLVEIEKTGGQEPRNFSIDPTGAFLLAANQKSDTIQVFRIDPATGALEPTEHTANVPAPVCLRIGSMPPSQAVPRAVRMQPARGNQRYINVGITSSAVFAERVGPR
ncbi:MAG: lactonase family protein [Planctomycetales bacterium]|nr:lactonase family protein [Planctomycetales bacterium]